jgi:dihydroorotase
VALLELREGAFEFVDNYKGTRSGKQRLFPIASLLAGKKTPARA